MDAHSLSSPLYERYASREMASLLTPAHRYGLWRRLWVALAQCQRELGLPISEEQIAALQARVDDIDFDRVAEIERETRHDVVAHIRHYAEQTGDAGGILHLGATSAFVTDNTDAIIAREVLRLLKRRLVTVIEGLANFAREHRDLPTLAYTHFQPAQLTTVGKRACLWLQDFVEDLAEVDYRLTTLRCRGVKGTTGTQASYLTLFDGDHDKVRELDRLFAERLDFVGTFPVTGQTYTRKQDSRILATLSGIGESAHKIGTDLRLLQGVGELSEPFGKNQVGSSAMAYKQNPIRAERMCGLSRRLISDSLNGPMNAATQWLERSLDDSANRRLVLGDAYLTADAVLTLAGHLAAGLVVHPEAIEARVARELPFMATETLLMEAVLRGGDRQHLHERIRLHSLAAQEAVVRGQMNPLIEAIADDEDFRLSRQEIEPWIEPSRFTGRSGNQVDEFLAEVVVPILETSERATVETIEV